MLSVSAALFFLLHPLGLHSPKTEKNNNKIAHTIGDNLEKKNRKKILLKKVNFLLTCKNTTNKKVCNLFAWLHEHAYRHIDLRTLRLID